jgi:hypothetical protein
LLLRFARQLTLVLLQAHLLAGYYPPRHGRRRRVVQPLWLRLEYAAFAEPRRLSPYPAFGAVPARVAVWHG